MNSNKHRKKSHEPRRERRHNHSKRDDAQRQIDKQKRHEEALALSQELRHLSSMKRLKECIDLYHSPKYDELRDAHHGSIVVDCCARCGDVDEAERIVHGMLQSGSGNPPKKEVCAYFWEGYKEFSYKNVPIQAWTALLKGYVHSGMMAKADSLFQYLCATHNSMAGGGGGGDKKGKRKREVTDNGPNVRTLNTLLRGCLWTATSLNTDKSVAIAGVSRNENELVGGVMTAERAWSLTDGGINFDSSSYEYFISVLSQSLQCKRAEGCLQKMRKQFGIPARIDARKDNEVPSDEVDPTLVESMVVSFVGIARAYALLGKTSDVQRCSEEALYYLDMIVASGDSVGPTSNKTSARKQTTGGKKAWKESRAPSDSKDEGNPDGRREESNKLFRNHRLSELRSEAMSLQNFCTQSTAPSSKREKSDHTIALNSASHVSQMMLTRLLYFSGGGTTGKDATKSGNASAKANIDDVTQQWMNSLWHSFGLKEVMQGLFDQEDQDGSLKRIFRSSSSKKQSKKHKRQLLPSVLSPKVCESLRADRVGKDSVISSDDRIDFTQVFKPLNNDIQRGKRLHIELGAGSGDWAALQAQLNPSEDYVTVELRADRVAQTFAKCLLNSQQADGRNKNSPLTNLCCVGSECGSFLRDKVEPGTVETVFVNHPEPPTQTYNVATKNDDGSSNPNSATVLGAEEPAHMLCSRTILSAARCLKPDGKGRLIIVTDNLIYARLICQTIVSAKEDAKLTSLHPSEVRDLWQIESFGHSPIHLYEGKPSLSIGHHIPHSRFEGGTSYFDRLWRTGAGKHADMKKRFIIALRTSGGNSDGDNTRNTPYRAPKLAENTSKSHGGNKGNKPYRALKSAENTSKSPKPPQGEGNKSSKKKSDEKQKRRNERRMLKKQQLAER